MFSDKLRAEKQAKGLLAYKFFLKPSLCAIRKSMTAVKWIYQSGPFRKLNRTWRDFASDFPSMPSPWNSMKILIFWEPENLSSGTNSEPLQVRVCRKFVSHALITFIKFERNANIGCGKSYLILEANNSTCDEIWNAKRLTIPRNEFYVCVESRSLCDLISDEKPRACTVFIKLISRRRRKAFPLCSLYLFNLSQLELFPGRSKTD